MDLRTQTATVSAAAASISTPASAIVSPSSPVAGTSFAIVAPATSVSAGSGVVSAGTAGAGVGSDGSPDTTGAAGSVGVAKTDAALKTNEGAEIVAAGGKSVEDGVIQGTMNYYVEGVTQVN